MMSGNPFPQNAWLTYAEATARWGNPTSPKQVEYILATTEALSAHPAVRALVAEAEARGMDRAAEIFAEMWRENDGYRIAKIRAEAAAIRRAAEETGT